MLHCRIFSCTCTGTWCYSVGSSVAPAHTHDALTLDCGCGTMCTKEKDRRQMSVDQARRFSFEYWAGVLLLLNLCPFFVAGVSLWGQELVKRALIESLYGDLFQKSCQETSYGELVQRSCQEVSYLDLAKKKLPKRVCTEISYRDLAKRYPIEILCRDLARRPLIKILPLDLVNRACRDSLSRYVFQRACTRSCQETTFCKV